MCSRSWKRKFNETHDDIELVIDSPNDATTIMKTRFIREDYPDIIGIGGDMNYSNFLDAGLLMDISDYEGLDNIKEAYLQMDKELELVSSGRCLRSALCSQRCRRAVQQRYL